jgi:hypothetical protein
MPSIYTPSHLEEPEPAQITTEEPTPKREPLSGAERQRLYRQRHGDTARKKDAERKAAKRAERKALRESHPATESHKWNRKLVREKLSVNQGRFLKNADRGKGVCWQLFDNIDGSRKLDLEYAETRQRAACEGLFDDPNLAEVYAQETCRTAIRLAYQCEVRPSGHGPDEDGDEWQGEGSTSIRTEGVGPGADDDEDDYDPIAGWLEFKPTTVGEVDSLSGCETAEFDASVTDVS